MSHMKGKALLIVERSDLEGSDYFYTYAPWKSITGHHGNEGSHEWAYIALNESLFSLPESCNKMVAGERIWVQVTYNLSGHTDYFGEFYEDLTFSKWKVIKRSKP